MSFYAEFADAYETVFPLRETTLDFLRRHIGPRARSVLDIGCGTGGCCGRLAAAGLRATGVDLDEAMIRRARALHPGADFRVLDMTRIGELPGIFDAAVCVGNVLPHLDPARLDRFLADLHARLAPGARWCLQTVNRDALPDRGDHDFPPLDAGDGLIFHRSYREIGDDGLRFLTRLTRGAELLFEGEVRLYPLRSGELEAAHRRAGFRTLGVYGDFSGAPYASSTSPACIQVHERPST